MKYEEIRQQIVDVARAMLAEGLVNLTAGNISVRIPGEALCAITPGRTPYTTMKAEDVLIVTLDGQVVEGRLKPSSETPMHTLILREMPEAGAVVHAHPPYATAFAVVRKPVPLICTEGLGVRAMQVLVAEYAVPGTEEIGRSALSALRQQPGSKGVLLANHGLLTVGDSLMEAYSVASKIETQAKVYHLALQVGSPVCMTEEQVQAIYNRYRG